MDHLNSNINLASQALSNNQSLSKIGNNTGLKNDQQLEEAAVDFEAVFLTQMLKPMFESIESDPIFGGGKGEEVFEGFLVEEYGKMLSKAGGIGLADHVKAEMIRMQEAASA